MRVASWLTPGVIVMTAGLVKLAAMAGSPLAHRWFLQPLALLMSVFTGEAFSENQAVYTYSSFVLDYSCAGINFFAICSLTTAIAFSPVKNSGHVRRSATLIAELAKPVLLVTAIYAVTLLANFVRVALSLRLLPLSEGRPWLHEAVGVVVFLSILISYSFFLNRIQNAKQPTVP